MRKKLLNSDEAAEFLGIKPQRVYSLAREGILPAVRLGRQIRFDQDQLEKWINDGGKALPGGWKNEKN